MSFDEQMDTPSTAQNLIINEIFQSLQDLVMEEGAPGLSAETALAAAAGLLGTSLHAKADTLASADAKDAFLHQQFKITDTYLRASISDTSKLDSLGDYASFFAATRAAACAQQKIVLTNNAFFSPHMPPDACGALLYPELIFKVKEQRLPPEDTVGLAQALISALFAMAQPPLTAITAYRLAMETAIGVAYTPLLDREKATAFKKAFLSKRLVAAGAEMTNIAIKQHLSFEHGTVHPPSLVAEVGAFLGRMTHKALNLPSSMGPTVVSADANDFLEMANIIIMSSYIRRGGDARKLAEYEEYAQNTMASFGKDPFPIHKVPAPFLPHDGAIFKAATLEESAAPVMQKYDLRGWEKPAAALVATNDCIRLAETRSSLNERSIPTAIAVRLAMEEASAHACLKADSVDDMLASLSPPVRAFLIQERDNAQKVIATIKLPFG